MSGEGIGKKSHEISNSDRTRLATIALIHHQFGNRHEAHLPVDGLRLRYLLFLADAEYHYQRKENYLGSWVYANGGPTLQGISLALADLDGLEIGTSIKISSISLPENVRPTIQGRDFVVATVAAPTVFKEPEKPAEELAAEGAEGADAGAEGAEGSTTEASSKEGGDKASEGEKGKEEQKKDQKASAEKK